MMGREPETAGIDREIATILERAWIVIPAFEEEETIARVIRDVRQFVPGVVVVDDGSRDHTFEESKAAGAVVLTHLINLGQGAALRTGIEYALSQGAGYLFTFDADGQHGAESLVALARTMAEKRVDVVLGSRRLGEAQGLPKFRRLALQAAVLFTRLHTGLPVTDTHNGLRLFTAMAAARLEIRQSRMAHASEILHRLAALELSWAEAPVTVLYTEYSLKKGQKLGGALHILGDLLVQVLAGSRRDGH